MGYIYQEKEVKDLSYLLITSSRWTVFLGSTTPARLDYAGLHTRVVTLQKGCLSTPQARAIMSWTWLYRAGARDLLGWWWHKAEEGAKPIAPKYLLLW